MGPQARREYVARMRERYVIADRTEKGRLLDEAVTVTGRHRKATRAIVTEYELPFELTNIHDVAGDLKGNTWFTINRHPFIGKLDPKTGKVVTYRVPDVDGEVPGNHWINVDTQGIVWFTPVWAGGLGRLSGRPPSQSSQIVGRNPLTDDRKKFLVDVLATPHRHMESAFDAGTRQDLRVASVMP